MGWLDKAKRAASRATEAAQSAATTAARVVTGEHKSSAEETAAQLRQDREKGVTKALPAMTNILAKRLTHRDIKMIIDPTYGAGESESKDSGLGEALSGAASAVGSAIGGMFNTALHNASNKKSMDGRLEEVLAETPDVRDDTPLNTAQHQKLCTIVKKHIEGIVAERNKRGGFFAHAETTWGQQSSDKKVIQLYAKLQGLVESKTKNDRDIHAGSLNLDLNNYNENIDPFRISNNVRLIDRGESPIDDHLTGITSQQQYIGKYIRHYLQ